MSSAARRAATFTSMEKNVTRQQVVKDQPETTEVGTEMLLRDVETLLQAMPPDRGKLAERRDYLAGQLRHARAQLASAEANRRQPEAQRLAEVQKWQTAISNNERELADVPVFSAAARHDGALAVLAYAEALSSARAATMARMEEMGRRKMDGTLTPADFPEWKELPGAVARVGKLVGTVDRLREEARAMVPAAVIEAREALERLAEALVEVPVGTAAGAAADRVRTWATAELQRLDEASVSKTWTELESFTVNPLA